MPKKKHNQNSFGDFVDKSNGVASVKHPVRADRRNLPGGIPECCSEKCQIVDHIRNQENAILLDIQSQAKIWALIIPILDEKAKDEGDFLVGGCAYSEIKKDMADLAARVLRNAQYVKKIVEFFSPADTIN
jgi:hypothetical protein